MVVIHAPSDHQLFFFHFATACGHNVLTVTGLTSALCLPWMGIQPAIIMITYSRCAQQARMLSSHPLCINGSIFLALLLQPYLTERYICESLSQAFQTSLSLFSQLTQTVGGVWSLAGGAVSVFSCQGSPVFGVSACLSAHTDPFFHMSTHCRSPAHTHISNIHSVIR